MFERCLEEEENDKKEEKNDKKEEKEIDIASRISN